MMEDREVHRAREILSMDLSKVFASVVLHRDQTMELHDYRVR